MCFLYFAFESAFGLCGRHFSRSFSPLLCGRLKCVGVSCVLLWFVWEALPFIRVVWSSFWFPYRSNRKSGFLSLLVSLGFALFRFVLDSSFFGPVSLLSLGFRKCTSFDSIRGFKYLQSAWSTKVQMFSFLFRGGFVSLHGPACFQLLSCIGLITSACFLPLTCPHNPASLLLHFYAVSLWSGLCGGLCSLLLCFHFRLVSSMRLSVSCLQNQMPIDLPFLACALLVFWYSSSLPLLVEWFWMIVVRSCWLLMVLGCSFRRSSLHFCYGFSTLDGLSRQHLTFAFCFCPTVAGFHRAFNSWSAGFVSGFFLGCTRGGSMVVVHFHPLLRLGIRFAFTQFHFHFISLLTLGASILHPLLRSSFLLVFWYLGPFMLVLFGFYPSLSRQHLTLASIQFLVRRFE